MSRLIKIIFTYKEIILYLFWGGLATLINVVCFYVLYGLYDINNVLSNCLAWFVSVLFAFVTNNFFVFNNKLFSLNSLLAKMFAFIGFRLFSGFVDVACMWLTVTFLKFNAVSMKVIINIIVIILNYISSKFYIFKNNSN